MQIVLSVQLLLLHNLGSTNTFYTLVLQMRTYDHKLLYTHRRVVIQEALVSSGLQLCLDYHSFTENLPYEKKVTFVGDAFGCALRFSIAGTTLAKSRSFVLQI